MAGDCRGGGKGRNPGEEKDQREEANQGWRTGRPFGDQKNDPRRSTERGDGPAGQRTAHLSEDGPLEEGDEKGGGSRAGDSTDKDSLSARAGERCPPLG